MTTSNGTVSSGCLPPFLSLAEFPYKGGLNSSRLCVPVGLDTCCLPCPVTDWIYSDNFNTLDTVTNWLNVAGTVCAIILLTSFIVLPVQKTSRHYLSICLVIAVIIFSFRSVVALATKPELCIDRITANDLFSNLPCAFTGSMILFGGFASVMWVFIRSLSLHLQICWQIVPGRKFFLLSLLGGFGVPSISLAVALVFTSISYRFGNTCILNHDNALATFWIPMFTFTGLAAALQFITLGYCIRVYIRSLMNPSETTENSSTLPSFAGTNSVRTVTAKAAYRRVRKVIALQWRGIMIVLIILANVTFFSTVFVKFDSETSHPMTLDSPAGPWLECLILHGGNKNACLSLVSPFVISEVTVMATLFLISLNGIWIVFFLGRWSMVTAWVDLIRSPFDRSHDHFVSVDARRMSDPRNYEMLTPQKLLKDDIMTSPTMDGHSQREFAAIKVNDYLGQEASYRNPNQSFSHPRPPTRSFSTAGKAQLQRDGVPVTSPSAREYTGRDFPGQEYVSSPAREYAASPGREYAASPSEYPRSGSAAAYGRSNSALGVDRSSSALGRERAGSALGREWDPRAPHARSAASPTPHRTNSRTGGLDWDPRTTYARGGASPEPAFPREAERGDSALGFARTADPVHLRGTPTDNRR